MLKALVFKGNKGRSNIVVSTLFICWTSLAFANNIGGQVAVDTVTVDQRTIYDWAYSEGLAQGIRREYLNFERGGKVTFIATDSNNIPVRAGSFVKGPKSGERFGQLLGKVDERTDAESVREAEAGLVAADLRIEQAESQLKQAQNNLNLATTSYERAEYIWKQKLIPKEQYESSRTELLNAQESLKTAKAELATARSQKKSTIAQLNQAKVALEKTSIFAPFDGVLRKVNVREGDFWAGPAAAISDRERESSSAMVIVDTSQYEITLNVPYYAADKLKEGQPVFISWSPAKLTNSSKKAFNDGQVTKGEVFSVSPSISLEQRAIEVKVHTSEGAALLKDGMHVTAWIMVDQKDNALTVPYEAIVTRNNKAYVYVANDDNTAGLVQVTTGVEGLENVEILSGLKAGMQVITAGNHKLVDGTAIRLVAGATNE